MVAPEDAIPSIDRGKAVELLASLGDSGPNALITEFGLPVSNRELLNTRAALAFDYAFEQSLDPTNERPIILRLLSRADQLKKAGAPTKYDIPKENSSVHQFAAHNVLLSSTPQNEHRKLYTILSFCFGTTFLMMILIIGVFIPEPKPFQTRIFAT